MTILLASLAMAEETSRPILDRLSTDKCPAQDITAKVPYTSPCDAVVLSLAQAEWFAKMVVYADAEASLRKIDTASFTAKLDMSKERADFYKALLEKPEKTPLPPAAWFAIGVGSGAFAVLGGAVAVRWANEVPVTVQE